MSARQGVRLAAWAAVAALAAAPRGTAAGDVGAESAFRAARQYTVRVRAVSQSPFFGEIRGAWFGAGFLVDAERGWIVTNAHVAGRSPSELEVAFADQDYQPAHKVYVDPFADIAVIALERGVPGHRVARLDRVSPAVVGEPVGAYGHPMGLPFTGTRGIVSALTDQGGPDLLQIDATVDHGNSGGPVISLQDGAVIGIATAMIEGSRSDRMNFATPIGEVQHILRLLHEGKDPSPPLLGVSLLQDEENRHTMRVAAVFDSLRWPLEPGDRLVRIQGEPDTLARLTDLVEGLRGRLRPATMLVDRDGHRLAVAVRPALRPRILELHGLKIDGAVIAPLLVDDDVAGPEPTRLVIHSVDPASDAQALSLGELDQLWSVDRRHFTDIDSLIAYVTARPRVPLHVVFRRASQEWNQEYEYQARDLPNQDVELVPPAKTEKPLAGP